MIKFIIIFMWLLSHMYAQTHTQPNTLLISWINCLIAYNKSKCFYHNLQYQQNHKVNQLIYTYAFWTKLYTSIYFWNQITAVYRFLTLPSLHIWQLNCLNFLWNAKSSNRDADVKYLQINIKSRFDYRVLTLVLFLL